MKTIVIDEKTGVLGAKIMFRIKGSKDPNKLYHFFTVGSADLFYQSHDLRMISVLKHSR